MTQPIQEPTPGREVSGLGYGARQLFRRPSPSAATPLIEWIRGRSTTDLGTSYTSLVFTEQANQYDTSIPTFAINGSGNLEIFQDGVYEFSLIETNMSLAVNVVTVSFIQVDAPSGPDPVTMTGGLAGGLAAQKLRRVDGNGTAIDTGGILSVPDWSANLVYEQGTFGATASEIEVSAYHEEDRTGVATAFPQFHFLCKRLGQSYDNA